MKLQDKLDAFKVQFELQAPAAAIEAFHRSTQELIDNGNASSQRDLRAIQQFFNELHAESQLPYSHLSRLLALSEGP